MDALKNSIKKVSKTLGIGDESIYRILNYNSLEEYQNSLKSDERLPEKNRDRIVTFIYLNAGLAGLFNKKIDRVKRWLTATEVDFSNLHEDLGTCKPLELMMNEHYNGINLVHVQVLYMRGIIGP